MSQSAKSERSFTASDKQQNIRITNITAAKAVSDAVRTSLGPRGMDKMIKDSKGEVTITNDGATILKQMEVIHPAAKMLVELSKSQDIEAGDGTTSVVVIAGEMLHQCSLLLERGIHPTAISEAFKEACDYATDVLTNMATPIDMNDEENLIKSAATSLASKLVSQNAPELAPIAVRAVRSILDSGAENVDLRDIKVEKCLGGTIDDSELIEGLVFVNKHVSHSAGGPTRIQNPKIGLIQFCLSAPKTDMENSIVVNDYSAMDRVLREERAYIVNICKKIVAAGCNVLLIQKSVLRDATNDLSLHYLAKNKVMVIRDIEREDVDFISRTIGLTPVAHIDQFTIDKLGTAENCVEENSEGGKIIRVTGILEHYSAGKTATILLRGSQQLVLDEAERSLHDALCVVRSLVKRKALLPGGGAPEIEMSQRLRRWANEKVGVSSQCIRAFAEALEVVPYTLSENAGLDPMRIVTELRNRHINGETDAGINVRRGTVSNMKEESVVQPLLVTFSAVTLATECVRMVLKIDDVVMVR